MKTLEQYKKEFRDSFVFTNGELVHFAPVVTEKIEAFLSQMYRELEENLVKQLDELADEAFSKIKDPVSERDYEYVLYYLRKVKPEVHVKNYIKVSLKEKENV